MREIAQRLLSAHRKGFLRSRPVFAHHAPASADITDLEKRVGRGLPEDLKSWLILVGFGDIDEALSLRNEWIQPVDQGELRGGFLFAQDELGNFYACAPHNGRIVFFSRSEAAHAVLAPSFRAFMEELERRDYTIIDWVSAVKLDPYAWSDA